MVWSVCVFAHNEERLLPRCLAALDGAAAGGEYVVHVMENGSRDDTARVARALAAADPRIRVHQAALADKANAWNDYVHRLADDADMHVFIDGDVQPGKGAFKSLAYAFEGSPQAHAAAALPTTGRSRRAWTKRLFAERWLSGNLYAMRSEALDLFRTKSIRLPVGAVGEDGLLSYLLVTDLKGGHDDSRRERIAIASGAFFEFDSLGPSLRDLKIYRRRLRRYSQRFFQNEVLYARLKTYGVEAMPERIDEIYTTETVAPLSPRRELPNFFVDLLTLRALKAKASAR